MKTDLIDELAQIPLVIFSIFVMVPLCNHCWEWWTREWKESKREMDEEKRRSADEN